MEGCLATIETMEGCLATIETMEGCFSTSTVSLLMS